MLAGSPRPRLGLRLASLFLVAIILLGGPGGLPMAQAEEPTPVPSPSGDRDCFFGISEAFRAPQLARQSGACWERVLFFWNTIQPDNAGQWLPSSQVTKAEIQTEVAAGMSVVGLLGNPPRWATRNGSVPKNLELPIDDENNYWARFVANIVGEYAGEIDYWIIWNEPDIDPGNPGSTWAGTEKEYYLLLKNAYLAARSANPDAKIIFGGTTYWADSMYNRPLFLERVLQAGSTDPTAVQNGYYFDAVAMHIYSMVSYVYTTPAHYRTALRQYGLRKPLWITETNIVPWDDPLVPLPAEHRRVTMEGQASYVLQAMALARAAGIERVQIYNMVDAIQHTAEPYGLVRDDGTPRPAYQAFQVASRYLLPGHSTFVREGSVDKVTIEAGARRTTVLWNTRAEPVQAHVWPVGTQAWQIASNGQGGSLPLPGDPNAPFYAFMLPGTSDGMGHLEIGAYAVGGKPMILVEEGIGQGLTMASGATYYPITGFSIAGAFQDFFVHRGGIRTFGYPISRPFKLLGSTVQFFQRQAMVLRPDGTVGLLNVLDPEFMPYSQINGAVFPKFDEEFLRGSPQPGEPGYADAALDFVRTNAPDEWGGMSVGFASTFFNAVRPNEAFPDGVVDQGLLQGFDMEIWGLPTSQPAQDPADHAVVYQRFQRGIMRHDANREVTEGLLLVEYLRNILTGQNLPADLETAAAGSRFYRQYNAAQPGWVGRPDQLPESDLSFAFEREPAPAS